jgi:hypothetical protein
MSAREFLSAVLPSSGHYCACELTKKKEHVFVQTIEEILTNVERWTEKQCDIYFALASFKEPGKREAANAQYLRSFFMDFDVSETPSPKKVGKVYESREDALASLDTFLAESGLGELGKPWVVSSGGGFHVYWPLDSDVPVAMWKPAAEALKRLAHKHTMAIDYSVPADAARVLRIPGTSNYKFTPPATVALVTEGDRFSFEAIKTLISSKLGGVESYAPAPVNIPGKRPTSMSATSVKLIENSETRFKDILVKTKNGTGCGQLQHYVDNAAEEGMEPLWRGWLSIAQKCSDGTKAAKWLSDLHPYAEERMHRKLAEIKGPYPCVKFDSENPGVCESCPHWGKITNPLMLGRVVLTDNTAKEVPVVEAVVAPPPPVAPTVMRPTPPRGFSYGKNGGIFKDVEKQDENKQNVTVQVLVLPYDLFVVDILQNPGGEHVVHMVAQRPTGTVQVTLPQRAVVSKDDTCKTLAEQNIVAAIGAGNDANLFAYVRACVEEASASRQPIKVPSSYGWQPDGTFVHNERIYVPNMPPRRVPMVELKNINKSTQPQGTLDAWRAFNRLLIKRGMHDILAMGMVGFGSPLMRFTGFYGMTFHIGSTESGTGKSLALDLAASVWGHPVHYRVGKKTSDVAMQQRLGMLNSLPLICDEITDKNRKDFEWFPSFLFDMTEGRGKERMEAGANKERLNLSIWQALCLMSSNTHTVDYLTGARKHSSEGELRRLLEMMMTVELQWEPHEIEIVKSLHLNFGVAGPIYAQFLVDNTEVVRDVVERTQTWLYKEYKATNDERFWLAGAACLVSAAILCGKQYADIMDYPIRAIVAEIGKLIEDARRNVRSNVRNAEDILNAFTRDNYGKFVVVRAINGALSATIGDNGVVDESITRSQIFGRVEHGIQPGYLVYVIEEQLLKAHCSAMSFGYADFRTQIGKLYKVAYGKRDLMAKTKGPQMRVNCIAITRVVEDEAPDES